MQGRALGLFNLIRSLRASEPPTHKKDALGDASERGGKRHHSAPSLLLNKAKTRDHHEDKCIYLPLAPLPRALPHEPILLSPPPQSLAPLPPRYVSSSPRGGSPTATLSGSKHRYYSLHSGALTIFLGRGALASYQELLREPCRGHTESDVVYTLVHCCVHVGTQRYTHVYTFPS